MILVWHSLLVGEMTVLVAFLPTNKLLVQMHIQEFGIRYFKLH
jgi:hypothetical protein